MIGLRTIADRDARGRRVLVRADLNVPMQDGIVTDATRIERFAEGMIPLLEQGACLVLLTHLGRSGGQRRDGMSVGQLVQPLARALGRPVRFCEYTCGPKAEEDAGALSDGEVLLCEYVRFEPGEEANDPALARALARLGDIYVNDAFSCAHRAHASTEGIARLIPSVAGPLMVEELDALAAALEAPKRPSVAIVGGAKVSSKIPVLRNLVAKVDRIIIGGGMANTFLFADGHPMGRSLHEADQVDTVADILARAARSGCEVLLPVDVVTARDFAAGAAHRTVPADGCAEDEMILDAGPESLRRFSEALQSSATILWNGPLGAFEIPPFDTATTALAQEAARLTRQGEVTSVAGGGDTVAALNAAGVSEDFTYVSAAGGAFLEWLEGRTPPGVAALMTTQDAA